MRALFEYNPEEDSLLPCKEIGLPFDRGDILQIVDQRDPNWWQAKKVGGENRTGLIPSLELEERRKAYVAPENDFVHKISICGEYENVCFVECGNIASGVNLLKLFFFLIQCDVAKFTSF